MFKKKCHSTFNYIHPTEIDLQFSIFKYKNLLHLMCYNYHIKTNCDTSDLIGKKV